MSPEPRRRRPPSGRAGPLPGEGVVGRTPDGPSERLLLEGPERLSTIELLAVLLGSRGRAGRSGDAAWRLLERFGGVRRIAAASVGELEAVPDVSTAAASRLVAAFALSRRAWAGRLDRGEPIRSTADVFERYASLARDARRERFVAVLLDAKNRVMREEIVSEGGLMSASAHPREVFGTALREAAASLLLVHNHPSGDPEPSEIDVDLTRRLVAVGELLGIPVVDHLIVGDGSFVSLLERGVVPRAT